MAAGTVAGVYAQALLALADERGKRTAVVECCRELPMAFDTDTIARLDDPRLGKDKAKATLKSALSGKIDDDVLNLLFLLIDRNRLSDVTAIANDVVRSAEADVGLVRVQVTTAETLDDSAKTRLHDSIKRIIGPGAVVQAITNSALIGGMTLRVGDLMVDGSVRRQLAEMKNRILDAPLSDRSLWDDA